MDALQRRVVQIALRYELGYLRQKERADQILEQMEALEYREELAKTNPELATLLEGHTRGEREQREELLCTALGVAHAILYALGETN